MGGQESSPGGGGVDVVEASFDLKEEGGDLGSRSLERLYFACEGEAGISGVDSR